MAWVYASYVSSRGYGSVYSTQGVDTNGEKLNRPVFIMWYETVSLTQGVDKNGLEFTRSVFIMWYVSISLTQGVDKNGGELNQPGCITWYWSVLSAQRKVYDLRKRIAQVFQRNFCKLFANNPSKEICTFLVFLHQTSGYLKFCKYFCIFEMAWSRAFV